MKNKKINFRQYDSKNKSWRYWGVDKESGEFTAPDPKLGYSFMSSGIDDMHGRPIYEGDVVISHDLFFADKKDRLLINYNDGCFTITDPKCCNSCKNGESGIGPLCDNALSVEIIGNNIENNE